MRKKAIIAMSGGVDSSVAAFLMLEQGFDCTGVTMKLFDQEDEQKENSCCSSDDINDARCVCNDLNIPYEVINFSGDFEKQVIQRFISAYQNGATPNPCIDCNRYIKFERLFTMLDRKDADYVVTGHYARVEKDYESGRYLLKKALDDTKDQSYVLYSLSQEQLKHVILPLGELRKTEVREIAEKNGFINAKKGDSQDICFVSDNDYAGFIEQYLKKTFPEGDFIDTQGNVLGKHKGIIRYTIGQRKGLGLSFEEPRYVCSKSAENNTVTLGKEEDLYSSSFDINTINLISCDKIEQPMKAKVRVRYKQKEQLATVIQISDDIIHIDFDEPQRAIAKGQSAVIYDGDVVVGGGKII